MKFLDDWKEFFGPIQPDHSVNRGFYNFYPVESKPATDGRLLRRPERQGQELQGQGVAHAVPRLSDPSDVETRLVWLGWGEMWRLRQKNEAYLSAFGRN